MLRCGLLCTESTVAGGHAVGGNPLDRALWDAPREHRAAADRTTGSALALLPFDHERRHGVRPRARPDGALTAVIVKGAPETVLARCAEPASRGAGRRWTEFAAGNRVVAVATAGRCTGARP